MAWAYFELIDFPHAVGQTRPPYDVAITPFAFRDPGHFEIHRGEYLVADSSRFPSVSNQRRRLYIWGNIGLECLNFDPTYRYICLLVGDYRNAGFTPKHCFGVMRTIPRDHLAGLTVIIENQGGGRYSSSSHISQLAMNNSLWAEEPKWPAKSETDDELAYRDKIVIIGGQRRWLSVSHS